METKSKFEDIVVTGAGHEDTAQGHIFRAVVPGGAQERIELVKLSSEMMVILDKIYEDPATSVSIIVNKLLFNITSQAVKLNWDIFISLQKKMESRANAQRLDYLDAG